MARHWIIYGLRDPEPPEDASFVTRAMYDPHVVYIGKSFDPTVRVKEHAVKALERVLAFEQEWQEQADNGAEDEQIGFEVEAPSDFTWWLAQHWRHGRLPEVVVLEVGTGDGWRDAEKRWIASARKLGLSLFNRTAGG